MHNAIAHQLPQAAAATPSQFPPSFNVQHDTIWYVISFGSVWVSCPGSMHKASCAHPAPSLAGQYEKVTSP